MLARMRACCAALLSRVSCKQTRRSSSSRVATTGERSALVAVVVAVAISGNGRRTAAATAAHGAKRGAVQTRSGTRGGNRVAAAAVESSARSCRRRAVGCFVCWTSFARRDRTSGTRRSPSSAGFVGAAVAHVHRRAAERPASRRLLSASSVVAARARVFVVNERPDTRQFRQSLTRSRCHES